MAVPKKALALVTGLIAGAAYFALSIVAFGGWTAFISHWTLIVLMLVTAAATFIAPFSRGNLSSGEKEDRGNRWVFVAFGLLMLASAVVPPYADRINFWTIGGETTRWAGVVLYAVGFVVRMWPVFVLGSRFSGVVAIQKEHTLETQGIYGLVRNPSYLGLLITYLGWGLAFRGWSGVLIAVLFLVPLVPRIRAEENLLREQFGAEYDAYVARTWRLVPGIY